MADSQSASSKIFSVRIVSIDYYMAPPIPDMDICYSSFQGGKVNEVPVIRIYGSTPAGQKTCLHVHRAFPYLYVPCSEISPNLLKDEDKFTNTICLELEKALKLKGSSSSKRQHVHGGSLVRARRFYGYHSSEELFVKIYLYYPHDVSRAANLLLGGAVLDKCLQPHESHIPFILQFLVDYNLYGMGLMHLSMMKFRHPVPDVFTSRKFVYNTLHGQEVDNSTFMSADFQADLSGRKGLDSPIWISSTIPGDWRWQFSSQFGSLSDQGICHVTRQSICELEGDAVVDEILNQQFKMYTSLSQTCADVKMVQSLIPIWEEENERTGMHEAAMPPDPGKPLPEDVLKVLSHGLEFEKKLSELCSNLEDNLHSIDNNTEFLQSSTSFAKEENSNEIGIVNSSNINEEHLNCSTEKDNLESLSLQDHVHMEKKIEIPTARMYACPKLFPISEIQSSKVVGSLDPKAADMEALGLLRWLATSHGAEDINSDDELVREAILSPLLPATTIAEVLEKANIDYESESQKECQDILDSVDDLIDLENLKEKASHSVDYRHHPQALSEEKVPQVDNLPFSPSEMTGTLAKTEKEGEFKMYFENKVFDTTGTSFSYKHKRKKSLWGSLPFSMAAKVNDDPQVLTSNAADDEWIGGSKNCMGQTMAVNKEGKAFDILKNADRDVCEASALVGCSVRDLMRKKRCRRVAQQDCGYVGITNVHSEEQGEGNILLPKRFDFNTLQKDDHDKQSLSPKIESPIPIQPSESPEAYVSRPTYPVCSLNIVQPLQGSTHTPSANTRNKGLQCHDSQKQDSTIYIVDCETTNCKDFDIGGVCSVEAKNSNVNFKSVIEHELFPADNNEPKHCYGSMNSAEKMHRTPNAIAMSIDVSADATVLQNEKCSAAKQGGDSGVVNTKGKLADLIGMTFCKKPPTVEWKNGAPEYALACPFNEESKDGIIGSALNDLKPFFEEDCQGIKEVQKESLPNGEETIMGVPTHVQNDGSLLYLLTPVYSPPTADCVCRWLLHYHKDASGELIKAESSGLLTMEGSSEINSPSLSPFDDNKALVESGYASHLMSKLDQAQEEINRNLNAEESLCGHDEAQIILQNEGNITKLKPHTDFSVDMSQISGPEGKSRSTPLSQIGFRDPASVGAGQQLTLLSIEVLAESRGDLRPDPRFDAINIVTLAFQNDSDTSVEVCVLLHTKSSRSSDGISGCMVLVFSEEKHIFSHFIRIICSVDPDILMGWDVQGSSLGFLAERAAHLGIGLINKISRTPLETNFGNLEKESPNKGIMDTVHNEPLIAESVLVEDAIIEDEWGRTHASGVHVGGRVVLNIWRLMRGEVKLNMYTVESVAEAVLRRKIPSIPYKVLAKWFLSGPGRARYRCIDYVIMRAKLNFEMMNQIDMINRTSELARIFGIDFFSVLSRGSQYRVESMFLRLAHTQNYLAVSPGSQQVASQPAMECLPLVMEPESGFYADPVVVLDFQSLYPSMIIAYNLCFCTCLGNVAPSKANTLGVSSFSPDPHVLRGLVDKILLTPNGVMYVPSEVRKGILPRLLEEILSTRIMVKQAMKKLAPSHKILHRIFNARQLALKLIANVTYGYTAAGFSGRMPCAELADSIVQCGRSTLEKAITLVNTNDKWKAKVIYGDTDSMFVLLKGRTVKDSFQIGREIASAVTAMNPNPVTLKLEKVYHSCFLLTKKRYVGYSYESDDQIEPVFDAKGIETVRRDTCGAVAKIMEQSLRLFFEHHNISEVKTYLQRQWTRILSGRVSLQDFVFAKEVRLGTYSSRSSSSLPPAAIVATKAMRADPRGEPRYAERVPYVVIHGEPGARLVDMVVDPLDLLAIDSPYRLNDLYYINKQIIPALQRVFGLVGADLNQWFTEMPRPVREALSKRTCYAPNPRRTRIDYYYLSKHCVLCGELVHATSHICNECSQKETAVATAVTGRISKLEREMQHLAAICRHCGGGDWVVDSGVKCTSLACSVFYERRKVQKELNGLSAVAADKGFYPKCNVEWF